MAAAGWLWQAKNPLQGILYVSLENNSRDKIVILAISIAALLKGLHTEKLLAPTNSRCHDISHGVQGPGCYPCIASENFAPHANVPIVL